MSSDTESAKGCEERDAALAQLQSLQAVARLASGLGHEFNNLMQTIMGGLQVVQKLVATGRAEETARFTQSAFLAAQTATSLNNRVGRLARPHAFDPKPLAVNELIAQVAEALRYFLARSIDLRTDTAPDLWPIACDHNECEIALLGLVLGTADRMPQGGVLTIATRNAPLEGAAANAPSLRSGDYVSIRVADLGVLPAPTADAGRHSKAQSTLQPSSNFPVQALARFARKAGGSVAFADAAQPSATTIYVPRMQSEPSAER